MQTISNWPTGLLVLAILLYGCQSGYQSQNKLNLIILKSNTAMITRVPENHEFEKRGAVDIVIELKKENYLFANGNIKEGQPIDSWNLGISDQDTLSFHFDWKGFKTEVAGVVYIPSYLDILRNTEESFYASIDSSNYPITDFMIVRTADSTRSLLEHFGLVLSKLQNDYSVSKYTSYLISREHRSSLILMTYTSSDSRLDKERFYSIISRQDGVLSEFTIFSPISFPTEMTSLLLNILMTSVDAKCSCSFSIWDNVLSVIELEPNLVPE